MAGASEDAQGAAFARTLSALKERGSSLLVVGTAHDRGHVAVCQRLLGEAAVDRRRLLVRTDGDCGAVPTGDDAEMRVVEQRTPGVGGPDRTVRVPSQIVPVGDLEELERATVAGFSALRDAGGDPEPSELRVCVDSLRPLLVDHDEMKVHRFVDRLGRRVADADGMTHFHLPTRNDDRYVSMLTPVVDAVVEVRIHEGEPQQRWNVLDGAIDSGWLSL